MWARSSLEIDLVGTTVSPDCLAILARSLSPSVKGLMLGKTDFAKGGNDLSGLCVLCLALSDASSCAGLLSLDLSDNSLKPDAAVVLAKAMRVNASLTKISLANNTLGEEGTKFICEAVKSNTTIKELDLSGGMSGNIGGAAGAKHVADMLNVTASLTVADLRFNNLDTESATALAAVAKEKQISLCGIKPEQTEANFQGETFKRMGPADAILLTADLAVRTSVTSIDVGYNNIGQAASLELLTAMKGKHMVSIGMANCELGVEGSKVVAKMISVMPSLTSIDLRGNFMKDEGRALLCKAVEGRAGFKLLL